MVKTGNECQTTCRHAVRIVVELFLRGSVVLAKFLLVFFSTRCLVKKNHQRVGCG